jgi:hypothetical protein
MAREFGAELAVLHAIPFPATGEGIYYFDPDWRIQLGKAAQQQISALMEDLGVSGEMYIDVGDIPSAVSNAAQRLSADL